MLAGRAMEGRSHTMRIVRKEMPAMLDAFVEKMLPKIIETEHKAPGGRDELLSALTFLTAEVQRLSDLTASSAKAAETERSHRINKVLLALSPSPPRPLPSPPAPSPSSRPRPHPPPCPIATLAPLPPLNPHRSAPPGSEPTRCCASGSSGIVGRSSQHGRPSAPRSATECVRR